MPAPQPLNTQWIGAASMFSAVFCIELPTDLGDDTLC